MPSAFSTFVRGIPAPKGSVSGFPNPKTGGVIITERRGSLQKNWQAAVHAVLSDKWKGPPLQNAVHVQLFFMFLRPKSVTVKKRPDHTITPDVDKLARGCLDAMKGIVFRDDAQVTLLEASKEYVDEEDAYGSGVGITVADLTQPTEGGK